jgi:serine/threonine-protein kinase
MSFWKRIFSKRVSKGPSTQPSTQPSAPPPSDAQPAAPAAPADAAPSSRDEAREKAKARERKRIQRLQRVGREDGADVSEAIAILRQHEGTPAQTRYLNAIIEGLSDDPSLDPLRVACASLLDARGQHVEALELIHVSRSIAGMMLAAELYASMGNLPRAVSMIERVLARDIDTPGARERHERWSEQLGRKPRALEIDDGATLVAPALQKTSFRLIREVARGGAGTVYEAEDELLGRRVAYKVYHRSDDDRGQIEREARSAARLTGPGVLEVYDVDPIEGWLATEWVARGSLRDIIRDGRIAEVLPLDAWLPALLRALTRVHDEGLVHSDLKPANVFFRSPTDPLLGDFGLCQPAGAAELTGTPGYMSPERLDGSVNDPRDDVYSIGRIIEDVLGARDDLELDEALMQASEPDARRWARIALECMRDAAARPDHARAILELARHITPSTAPPAD